MNSELQNAQLKGFYYDVRSRLTTLVGVRRLQFSSFSRVNLIHTLKNKVTHLPMWGPHLDTWILGVLGAPKVQ